MDHCPEFIGMDIEKRQHTVKKLKLCNNCFRNNHETIFCFRRSFCNQSGCSEKHHRLLHSKPLMESKENESRIYLTTKNDASYAQQAILLRTIPAWLSANGRRIRVNVLLDDASNCSYVSEKVSEQLKLTGEIVEQKVEVVGGNVKHLMVKMIEVTLESDDKREKRIINAMSVAKPTGALNASNWSIEKRNWKHLQEIPFPKIEKGKEIDMLLGADYADLQILLREVNGNVGEPVARLTPLGWTCVGRMTSNKGDSKSTHYLRTFFTKEVNLEKIVE